MKNRVIFSLLIIGLLSFSISSCKKYDDGPTISLRSKKGRVANTWKIEKQYKNGTEQSLSSFDLSQKWTLEKDGSATYSSTLGTSTGTWDFVSDKEAIQTSFTTGGFIKITTNTQYTILRLKEKELWLKYNDIAGNEFEIHLVEA